MTDFNTSIANAAAAEKAGFKFMHAGADDRADEQFERASQLRKLAQRQWEAHLASLTANQDHLNMLKDARRLLDLGEPLSVVAASFGYTPTELGEALYGAGI